MLFKIEKFVCDVLTGMNEYICNFAELVNGYWNGEKQFIDEYKVSEYCNRTDTGESNESILERIEIGNDYRLSESFYDIPYREYAQFAGVKKFVFTIFEILTLHCLQAKV